MKKKIFQCFSFMFVFVMLFSVNVFAASSTADEVKSLESQIKNGKVSDSFTLTYHDHFGNASYVSFDVTCYYYAEWNEGYSGWVNEAVFFMNNVTVGGESVSFKELYEESKESGSTRYMDYNIANSGYIVRVSVSCDEWGDVSIYAHCEHDPALDKDMK